MKNFTDKLYSELLEELELYADLGTLPVRRVTGAIHSIQNAFSKLKTHLAGQPFASRSEEIAFFKEDKPRFTAEHFYAMELFTIETARPLNDKELLKAFYEQELRYISRFREQNKFLHAYYQFGLQELDHLLFVRGSRPADIPVPDNVGLDPAFTTSCDLLWGRFIAFERLEEWLNRELQSMHHPETVKAQDQDNSAAGRPGGLRWTGESINLVELAYGIWLTGQVNNGQVSVTEITEFLENVFRIRIGKPHRRWQSIAGRKRLGYTKYINEIRSAIEKRIEEELAR